MKTRYDPYLCLEDQTYISEEMEELLYERWLEKVKKEADEKEERERKLRQDLWNLFFIANICFLHDREHCCECRVYATATCPSAKEESTLPNDF